MKAKLFGIWFAVGLILFQLTYDVRSEVTIGVTYTKENAKEVEKMLPKPVFNWLQNGLIEIKTAKVENPFTGSSKFRKASQENLDKYSIDAEGNLIGVKTEKIPEFLYGLPFPKIDAADPNAGTKIMWNFYFQQFQLSSQNYKYDICWVSYSSYERNFTGNWKRLFYTGRYNGPIDNPDNVDFKDIITVTAPYDVAGIATLLYRNKEGGGIAKDQLWTYAPALRRIRKLSPANSSDAFLGSDIANDDAAGYRAKIQDFSWKYLGEAVLLCPQGTVKPAKLVYSEAEHGYVTTKETPFILYGYDFKDWKGAAWAPMNIVWDIRPVYIVQGDPKDPYYSYGKQIFTLDKEGFCIYNKEIYDHSGVYWKNMLSGYNWIYAPEKENEISNWMVEFHCIVDEKSKHATVTHSFVDNPPCVFASDDITDKDFTMKTLLEQGK